MVSLIPLFDVLNLVITSLSISPQNVQSDCVLFLSFAL